MSKRVVHDQLGRKIHLSDAPKRIVSLVPSQTEYLADLGLEEEVIGITKFCVQPSHWADQKQLIGGTKNVKVKKIVPLQPDLIIGNKEENTQRTVQRLEKQFPVWLSDIRTVEDALGMLEDIGKITNREERALEWQTNIREMVPELKSEKLKVAYFIWADPFMVVGGNTYINDFLSRSGFQNVFADRDRYPRIELDELSEAQPDFILLSSEPYPFEDQHKSWFSNFLPSDRVYLVRGDYFSWYGSRMYKGFKYATQLYKNLSRQLK